MSWMQVALLYTQSRAKCLQLLLCCAVTYMHQIELQTDSCKSFRSETIPLTVFVITPLSLQYLPLKEQ